MELDRFCSSCGKRNDENEYNNYGIRILHHKSCKPEYNYCTVCGQKLTDSNRTGNRKTHCRICNSAIMRSRNKGLKLDIIDDTPHIECDRCHRMLPVDRFVSGKNCNSFCDDCLAISLEESKMKKKERQKQKYHESHANNRLLYRCSCCLRELPPSAFGQLPTSWKGHRCVDCKGKKTKYKLGAKKNTDGTVTVRKFVKIYIHGSGYSTFEKVPGHGDEACAKCALYDYENECRSYDCTGHYLRIAQPGRESLTVTIEQ